MKTLPDFLVLARKKYLQARSLDYYLQTDVAQELIKKANDQQKEQLYAHLAKGERELFIALLDKIRDSDMATMSVMALRRLARHLGILDYHILLKEQLLVGIKLRQNKNAAKILENERSDREAAAIPVTPAGVGG